MADSKQAAVMREKDRKWLERVRLYSDGTSGLYRGIECDRLPLSATKRLYALGYIVSMVPHNPVHKERWAISLEGRAALSAWEASNG
ncbi:MAG: hypothetical protein WBF99_12575 [Xanthobacteraceae bacterium]